METHVEFEASFANVKVALASGHWGATEERPARVRGYSVCQRLSADHPALRIGNMPAREAFPRVHSVGFLPPGQSVRLYPQEPPFRALNCVFDEDYFVSATQIDRDGWQENMRSLMTIRSRRIEALMQAIYFELLNPGFGNALMIEAASTMILVELGRIGQRLSQPHNETGVNQCLAPWQVRRINERIDASLELGYPSPMELAKLCGISQSHLMRTFKASTGWQICKYIAHHRLQEAKRLLAEDHASIKAIAVRLGFCNSAYFATAFRRMTGIAPKDFRKQARALDAPGPLRIH